MFMHFFCKFAFMKNPVKRLWNAVRHYRNVHKAPLHVEFVLSDFCNLNCKGCTHFSPLAPKEFVGLEQLENTATHIGNTCGRGLDKVFLMGGETLLYPHLDEAMAIMRKAFPNQQLYLFTNGILLPKMDEGFWEACRKDDFIIAITIYPINFDYEVAINICRDKGVKVEVFGDRAKPETFFRFALDPEKKQNGTVSHFKCFNRGCLTVIGDRVYPCSVSACVEHLNKAKGTDFRHEEGDWIAVQDIKSADDLRKLRDRTAPFCSYCIPPVAVDYGPSKREASEWVVMPEK